VAQVTGDWQLTAGQVPFGLSGGLSTLCPGGMSNPRVAPVRAVRAVPGAGC
jgi:hypothetical protein